MGTTQQPNNALLRTLPRVEDVIAHPTLAQLEQSLPHAIVANAARAAVDAARQSILAGNAPQTDVATIAQAAADEAGKLLAPSLRRVVNATGVILHTNLGRSPLAPQAVDAVNNVMAGYSTLEYSTDAMERGSRHDHCEHLICALTGAEAAIAVNNNAAAVMMVLAEFARGHEAVVSRGELIEIGGSFRIPDIMEASCAQMVEVGTTNKTHATDYERAIGPNTRMLLKVHPSNYRLIGFTETVGIADLRAIADAANADAARMQAGVSARVLVYEDQGSGAFARLDCFGAYAEPTIAQSLAAGADLVSFSGDKLLGGPQAGIIVGSADLIDRLKKNPLARAMRLDKMTLAALEATLRLYLQPNEARANIPVLRMLTETAADVKPRAEALAGQLAAAVAAVAAVANAIEATVVEEVSRAGGGALPMCDIPTYAVSVTFARGSAQSCAEYLARNRSVPVIARVGNDRLVLDARTLLDENDIVEVVDGIVAYLGTLDR